MVAHRLFLDGNVLVVARHQLSEIPEFLQQDGAVASFLLRHLKGELTDSLVDKIGLLLMIPGLILMLPGLALMLPSLRGVARRLDYAEYGGALLMGVDGVVIVGHGRSNAKAVKNAIRQARLAVEGGVMDVVRASAIVEGEDNDES